ncbi:MAG: hypothetical protein LBH32_09720 [Dysgonamonadaceae bacterium]|jgi:hypothetical protein|nr:hypothetical protein [Dysgonamonadaceae bacterium]
MNKFILKILPTVLSLIALFSACSDKSKNQQDIAEIVVIDEESDEMPQIPQITAIQKTPERLANSNETYTVTLQIAKMEDTEFSMDGTTWQKDNVFQNIAGGRKYAFYVRNAKAKSLLDRKEMYFEEYINVAVPTKEQLNAYLKLIADCNDEAGDEIRKCLGNDCIVKGAGNIHDVKQLIRETCMNSTVFSVTNIEVKGGIVKSISVTVNTKS